MQTFHSVDAALAFKESFYERVQRPPHTRLPGQVAPPLCGAADGKGSQYPIPTTQVTLLVQNHATILNEFDLAYLLAEGILPRLLRAGDEPKHPNPAHGTTHDTQFRACQSP